MKKRSRPPASTPASTIEINPEFRRALDVMETTGKNIFITGKAGTGKSTLLDYFRNATRKKVAVLAPTGVAALNVRGQTIHSFCRFKPDITLDKVKKISGKGAALYKNLDAVIIDEISMVRADLLDCVERFLRLNGPHPKKRFGGIQMIFIGDLYQLPPVVTSAERNVFSTQYETPYFFSSRIFNEPGFDMEFVELEKIYRQTEEDFILLLNATRNRSVTDEDIGRLNRRCDAGFVPPDEDFYIHLTSTNDLAYKRNQEKLALVREAIRNGGELEIVYLKTDDTKTRRRIRPESIERMEYMGRQFEGLRAYCFKRGEERNFRIDRMLEVRLVE